MYIQPNSTIKLLTNCPLDKTYEHTIYFTSKTQQENYFSSLTKYSFNNLQYVRKANGIVKVQRKSDDCYDCNYMMFKNESYGNKWFYAFVDSVDYVNNTTCYINFTIDYMQTWLLDFTLKECFVEREHSVTDVIGENLQPENLEIGNYITTNEADLSESIDNYENLKHNTIVIFATEKVTVSSDIPFSSEISGHTAPPQKMFGYINPCYIMFPKKMGLAITPNLDESGMTKAIIDAYAKSGKTDSIVSIFAVPEYLLTLSTFEDVLKLPKHITWNPASRHQSNRSDGKAIQNNKLYTYPYCCLAIQANSENVILRYEDFDITPSLISTFVLTPTSSVYTIPKYYEGETKNFKYGVTLKGFMLLPYVKDYYQNWIAQNDSVIRTGLVNNITNGLISIAGGATVFATTSNPMGLISVAGGTNSIINSVRSTLAEVDRAQIIPDNLIGNVSGVTTLSADEALDVRTYCRAIKPEFVTIVDEYFTRFGYSTHKTKIPNINSRPRWNFVKTIACTIVGPVPADDMMSICKLFDNGITFWKYRNDMDIGNYTLNNKP